jgi:8-oxo-dGTP diphosphatase
MIHVVAGVLIDAAGRVLLAQRPPGKHLALMWEFPGGKVEPGEDARPALARELAEELGIAIGEAAPLMQLPWDYDGKRLLLDVFVVETWVGEPRSLEGQALRWVLPAEADCIDLAPADRPVLRELARTVPFRR